MPTNYSDQSAELIFIERGNPASRIAVIVPCYRVKAQILDVIARIGPEVEKIYVVDDCCPDASGQYVKSECRDPRVKVLFHDSNNGVGGAMITGYRNAVEDGATVVVKID